MATQGTLTALWGQPTTKKRVAEVDPEAAPTPAKRSALIDLTRDDCEEEKKERDDECPETTQKCVVPALQLKQASPALPKKSVAPPALQLKQASPALPKKIAKKADGGGGGGRNEQYKSVTQVSVQGAEYFDQSIGWAYLRDGRELLLGCEVWQVPAAFAKHPKQNPPTRVGTMPESLNNRFTPLAGTDLVAVMGGSLFCKDPPVLTIHALPACEEVARLQLPEGAGHIAHITSCSSSTPGDGCPMQVLLANDNHLFLVSVTENAGDAPRAEMTLSVDLRSEACPLSAVLRGGGTRRIQSVALWLDATKHLHACLGNQGRVLVVPLSGPDKRLYSEASSVRAARSINMHSPMRKSDTDACVHDMDLWFQQGGAIKLVTVGSDGLMCVTGLHDGSRLLEGSYPDTSWHCTSRGSGGSKGYPYAPAFTVTVGGRQLKNRRHVARCSNCAD